MNLRQIIYEKYKVNYLYTQESNIKFTITYLRGLITYYYLSTSLMNKF
jgi:hypothetical protein